MGALSLRNSIGNFQVNILQSYHSYKIGHSAPAQSLLGICTYITFINCLVYWTSQDNIKEK